MSATESPNEQGPLVLLVEDNVHNRAIFAQVLAHYGYEVREAENGEQAVRLATELRPAVILMDLSLPVLDGWEATRKIKADPQLAEIPIIALTAHAMKGDDDRALGVGCDGYLAKPISPKRVVEAVAAVVRGERPPGR